MVEAEAEVANYPARPFGEDEKIQGPCGTSRRDLRIIN